MKKFSIFLAFIILLVVPFGVVGSGCGHKHVYDKMNISSDCIASEANCTEKAKYYYTCECGEIGLETFEYGEKLTHSFTNYVSDNNATYTRDGSKTAICDLGCGEKDVITDLNTQKIFKYNEVKIPILSFTGDISTMTKKNEVSLAVKYENEEGVINCDATLKWQGSSSLSYPKKNFTMKLLKKGTDKKLKVEMKEGWGEQNKYCLKANYIDFSHARNVVSGRLYSQIVKSREFNDKIDSLANGGAVDGFPILIYFNNQYQGLYTLNIPKDKWMFGMNDDDPDDLEVQKQALLMADQWSDEVCLNKTIDGTLGGANFDLEFCSTEDTIGVDWVKQSFNQMIDFVINNDGQAFRDGISNYLNVERTIDSLLFTWLMCAYDNVAKNIIWVTYDGKQWFSSMYDMDSTWGIMYTGAQQDVSSNFFNNNTLVNQAWLKLLKNYKNEIEARYLELRQDVLSEKNIALQFLSFSSEIPDVLKDCEKEKWQQIPSITHGSIEYIFKFTKKSLSVMDNYFSS